MAKRSRLDELDQVVTGILSHPEAPLPADTDLALLARIAAELTRLPRPEFRARLKSDLERKKSMATATEPVTRVRQSAAPRLRIKDAPAAIEFYKRAFGAHENMRFANEAMGLIHAEIQIGNAIIMVAEESLQNEMPGPQTLGGSPVTFELFVEDSDAAVGRAIAAGARLTSPVQDHFYGYRAGTVADPFGYSWTIATVKEEMSVEEMRRRFEPTMQRMLKKPAVDPIPEGYRTVTPYLVAQDGSALLEFAKQAFGAEEKFRGTGGAGGLHAEVTIGDSRLMIGGGIPGREFRSTANTTALHVYVKDTDAVYKQALAAGATSISAPADQEYGERSAGVKDPAGNYWYIATHKGPTYIPVGLNNVNVYMHPWRGDPVINFLKRAFGAQESGRYATPDGIIHHAEIRVGSSVVELGEAHGPYQPMQSMFYVYVPDCDAVYHRALRAGATSISEPVDHPYGDRSGGVKDAFGNQWYISTHIR
ncbi:MAG: VOC family protein, partial [Candidatus Nitrosopolaris sp.]